MQHTIADSESHAHPPRKWMFRSHWGECAQSSCDSDHNGVITITETASRRNLQKFEVEASSSTREKVVSLYTWMQPHLSSFLRSAKDEAHCVPSCGQMPLGIWMATGAKSEKLAKAGRWPWMLRSVGGIRQKWRVERCVMASKLQAPHPTALSSGKNCLHWSQPEHLLTLPPMPGQSRTGSFTNRRSSQGRSFLDPRLDRKSSCWVTFLHLGDDLIDIVRGVARDDSFWKKKIQPWIRDKLGWTAFWK